MIGTVTIVSVLPYKSNGFAFTGQKTVYLLVGADSLVGSTPT